MRLGVLARRARRRRRQGRSGAIGQRPIPRRDVGRADRSAGGEASRYRNASSRLAEIRRKATPPIPFRTHDLRHLFAVDSLKGGGSIYDLQQALRHRSIRTTEIYLEFLTAEEQRVAKRLAGMGA